jgi:hypothetical protein
VNVIPKRLSLAIRGFCLGLGFQVRFYFLFLGGPYFIPIPNLLFMEFVAPSFDSSSSSSDEELLDEIDSEHQIAMQATIACVNTWEFFTPTELEEGGGQYVDPNIGVCETF